MSVDSAPSTTGTAGTADSRERPSAGGIAVRVIAATFGAVYLAVGVIGAVVTGWSAPLGMHDSHVLIFQVNPVHNVAHLGLGAALLVGAALSVAAARSTARLVGVVFALLAVLGPVVMGMSMNVLSLNDWDQLLHLGTAGALLAAAWVARPRSA